MNDPQSNSFTLQGTRSPNRRARSVGYDNISRGRLHHYHGLHQVGNVGLVPVPKGILKTDHHGTNGKSPSRNEGSCCCCIDHLALTSEAAVMSTEAAATTSGIYWPPHQPQPSLPLHHPDHPFHFHVSHCHTANAQWRPEDQVAVLESAADRGQRRGCSVVQGGGVAASLVGKMPATNIRNPIALKSRNSAGAVGQTSSSIDLFYHGHGGQQRLPRPPPTPPRGRRRSLHEGRGLDSNTAKVQKQQEEARTHNRRPLGKKNGKTEAISGSKTTSSSSKTSSWSTKVTHNIISTVHKPENIFLATNMSQ